MEGDTGDAVGGGDAANPGGSNSQPLNVDSDSDDEPGDAREDKSVTPAAAAAPASPPGTTATSTGGSDDAIMAAAAVTMPTLPAGFNAAHPGVDGTARANSPQPPPPVVAQPGEIPQADATGAKFSEAEKPVFVLLKQGATPAQKQQLSDVLRQLRRHRWKGHRRLRGALQCCGQRSVQHVSIRSCVRLGDVQRQFPRHQCRCR